MRRLVLFPLAGLVLLAACNRHREEAPPPENNAAEAPKNVTAPPPVEHNAAEAPKNVTADAAPPPAFSDDAQMRDDADATGLTTRLPPREGDGGAGNSAAPAE